MSAIELRDRVLIRTWADLPSGEFSVTQSFDAGDRIWAKVEPIKAGIYYGSKQTGNDVTHIITIRRCTAWTEATVTGSQVFEHGGARYRVKRVTRSRLQPRYLEVECELLGALDA